MLRVARERATAGTAGRGGRGCCSTVWKTSREGGWTSTHTIDERWEASLLHRVEVEGSEYGEAWSTCGALGVGSGRGTGRAACGVVTPPTHGGQLSGNAALPPSGARALLLRAEETRGPVRGASPSGRHHRHPREGPGRHGAPGDRRYHHRYWYRRQSQFRRRWFGPLGCCLQLPPRSSTLASRPPDKPEEEEGPPHPLVTQQYKTRPIF